MNPSKPLRFKKSLLATLIGAALAPQVGWSLDFAQSPPGTVEPYVAPNVILSLDDSGSMSYIMTDDREPKANSNEISRATILKNAVLDVFRDTDLLPDGKIRLAWQTMNECTKVPVGTGSATENWAPQLNATSITNKNSMRVLEGDHRNNFITYMTNYMSKSPRNCGGTPTHDVSRNADQYMRAALNANGPWATVPGQKNPAYLGCRRNYHILLTDGGWNGTERTTSPRNYDGSELTFPDSVPYNNTAQTKLYWDGDTQTTIADWAMKSWAEQLQSPSALQGKVSLSAEYQNAPLTETFVRKAGTYRRIDGGGNITFGSEKKVTLEKYWNPRLNPASWPHMVTYTIGFSSDALPKTNYTTGGNTASGNNQYMVFPTSLQPFGYDSNFVDYADGTYRFKAVSDKGHDMWHAALNGRGGFYAVEKGEDLKNAFREIVKTINTETLPELGATAASGSSASRNDVELFTAKYEPDFKWRGFISGQLLKKDGSVATDGSLFGIPGWQGKTTAQRLDELASHSSRVILSWSDNSNAGVPFRWASDQRYLSTAQKAALDRKNTGTDTADGLGEARLNYIRGDQSREGTDSPQNYTDTKVFRERKSRQGDIINSNIWYLSKPVSNYPLTGYANFTRTQDNRTPMIYVGGNDGMLHGFSAADGSEKVAYVPRGVIPGLPWLTIPGYSSKHRYFVDGSPMTGDINLSTSSANWRTMLVGSMGAGGKGYFVLNVTNPSAFVETSAADLVVLDKTRHVSETYADCSVITNLTARGTCEESEDLGHIFAAPVLDEINPKRSAQITRLNNDRWAVIMGNGYNSKNQRPVLLIQYLDGAKELVRLVATGDTAVGANANTTDNGLSAPRPVDINADGRPDIVYAGDIKGNLWKFDIASGTPSKWNVAFGGNPLFTARGPAAPSDAIAARTLTQPIVVPPTARANDRKKNVTTSSGTQRVNVGGMMVAFGTGRNVSKDDPESMAVQSLYSVIDNTRYKKVGEHIEVCTKINSDANVKDEDAAPNACSISRDDLPKTISSSSSHNIDLLARQSINNNSKQTGTGVSKDVDFWQLTGSAVNWSSQLGWFLDLPQTGERLLKPMEYFDGSNLLSVYSQVPARGAERGTQIIGETCEATAVNDERQYLTLLNIMDGARPSIPVMDLNGDGLYNTSDQNVARMLVDKGAQNQISKGGEILNRGNKRQDKLKRLPENSMRPSWRQLS